MCEQAQAEAGGAAPGELAATTTLPPSIYLAMGQLPRLLCCLLLSLSLAAAARAATVHQEWEVSTVHQEWEVSRSSLLTENLAIHWHGIRQIGTPWADGTEGVTQCPILPASLLINGRGRFVNCSAMAAARACNATHTEWAAPVFAVVPDMIFNNFEFEGHEMTVMEADGHYVKPFVVKNLINIYSGESYSVLIKANQDPNRNYWLASNVISREPGTPTGTAVLSYFGGRSSPRRSPPTTPPTGPTWNDTAYRFNQSVATVAHPAHVEPPPPTADCIILLLNTQNKIDARNKWALNNISFPLPHTPYLVAILPGDTVVNRPETYMYHAHYWTQRSAELNDCLIVNVLLNDWWHNSTYERGTGLASVPLVPIMNGRVWVYRFRLASVTSLSALIFEIEDRNARLIGNPAVPSGSTSSRRPFMGYRLGAALVAAMFCMFLPPGQHRVADQNPAAGESTMARFGLASSASGILPVGGGHTASPSQPLASSSSSTDPAYGNRSSKTSSPSGEETVRAEEDPSGPPPQRRTVVSPAVPRPRNVEGPLLNVVLALSGYAAAAATGILAAFGSIVGTWSTAPKVVYGVLTVVAVASSMVSLMTALWHARAGNINGLSVSTFCARLSAIIFTSLLVVAISCKLGRWARVTAVPSAAVIACILVAVWIWGDEHAMANAVGRILGQRREREPAAAGDDTV